MDQGRDDLAEAARLRVALAARFGLPVSLEQACELLAAARGSDLPDNEAFRKEA